MSSSLAERAALLTGGALLGGVLVYKCMKEQHAHKPEAAEDEHKEVGRYEEDCSPTGPFPPAGDDYTLRSYGAGEERLELDPDDEEEGLQRTHSANHVDLAFDRVDKDHTGRISEEQFVIAITKDLDLDMSRPEARRLFEQIDRDYGGSAGEIYKSTFRTAVQHNTFLATIVSEYTNERSERQEQHREEASRNASDEGRRRQPHELLIPSCRWRGRRWQCRLQPGRGNPGSRSVLSPWRQLRCVFQWPCQSRYPPDTEREEFREPPY